MIPRVHLRQRKPPSADGMRRRGRVMFGGLSAVIQRVTVGGVTGWRGLTGYMADNLSLVREPLVPLAVEWPRRTDPEPYSLKRVYAPIEDEL